jgi:hypothetical protein
MTRSICAASGRRVSFHVLAILIVLFLAGYLPGSVPACV